MAEGLAPAGDLYYVETQVKVAALDIAPFAAYTLVTGSGGVAQIAQGVVASFVGGKIAANAPSAGIHPQSWMKPAIAGVLMGAYAYATGNPDFVKTAAVFAGLNYVGSAILTPAVFK